MLKPRHTARTEQHLRGVHPDLVRVVRRALTISKIPFVVTDGVRTQAEQRALVRSGASKTMNSRHLTGHAVDIAAVVNGKVRWDWPLYKQISIAFKEAARLEKVPIVWGGDWKNFRDGPHYELDRKVYP